MKKSRSCTFIKNYRKQLGLSQAEFAESLSREMGVKISRQQVANWELGRSGVPGDVIICLVDPCDAGLLKCA